MRKQTTTAGFTLIELLVVIAIIGLLSSVVMASLNTARAKARDANRLATVREIQKALELYYNVNTKYPPMDTDNSCNGYEGYTTTNNDFMKSLVTAGFLSQYPTDPSREHCSLQYLDRLAGQGYTLFFKRETAPASGCVPAHDIWSCVGVRMSEQ